MIKYEKFDTKAYEDVRAEFEFTRRRLDLEDRDHKMLFHMVLRCLITPHINAGEDDG